MPGGSRSAGLISGSDSASVSLPALLQLTFLPPFPASPALPCTMVPTRDTSTAPLAATPKLRGPVTGATTICMGRKGAQTGLGKGGNVRPRPFAPPLPLPVVLSALDHALSAALAGMVVQGTIPASVQGTIPATAVPCTTLPASAVHGQGFATWGELCNSLAQCTPVQSLVLCQIQRVV